MAVLIRRTTQLGCEGMKVLTEYSMVRISPALNSSCILLRMLIVVALLCGIAGGLQAQQGKPNFDSKGKEFWVTFMESFGGGGQGGGNSGNPDMRLYVSCDRPTTVSITYQASGQKFTINLPTANVSTEININQLFGNYVELEAAEQGVSDKAFNIVADDDITLYGSTVRPMSADAFLGLPDDILTRRYIVLAYPNGYSAPNGQGPQGYDMPSEFAVIATEDGTELRITPSAELNGVLNKKTFNVNLNRGQVYFAQAELDGPQDVSGTEVLATKPIAVFAGNKRTSIPTAVGNYRDYLVEQMPPLETWGMQAIVTPHFPITPQSNYTAVVRVLAAFDGTTWSVNGSPRSPLQAAVSVEIPLIDKPMLISASGPIMVAQYEHSVGSGGGGGFDLGDPFMMLIPPPEQYDTAYAFQCINHSELPRHYVNVVIPSSAEGSLMLDGNPVTAKFNGIPNTTFRYAQIAMTPGSHYIRADSAFGLYVYGFGPANSYGYPGGMLFRTLVTDFQAPEIAPALGCNRLDGLVYDSRITDTGIDSLFSIADSLKNVNLTIDPFTRGADSVYYHATLIDPYQDGQLAVKAIDSGGRSRTQFNRISGFTLRAVGMTGNQPALSDTLVVFNGQLFCTTFDIENYGAFEKTIDSISLVGTGLSGVTINATLPMKIAPGGRQAVNVCYNGKLDTACTVGLQIWGGCDRREVMSIPIVSRVDTSAPGYSRRDDPCGNGYDLSFNEPYGFASGVGMVMIDTLVNCTVRFLPDTTRLPVAMLVTHLERIDPRQDLIYRIRLRDVVGNEETISDTLGGFTLAVTALGGDTLSLWRQQDWTGDSLVVGTRRCDSVVIGNYGMRRLRLSRVWMRGNGSYSIPPEQMPIELLPGETRKLAVCISGDRAGEEVDTLVAEGSCGIDEEVLMKAPVSWVYGLGEDGCNNALRIQMFAATKRTFLNYPVPNPVTASSAYIDLGLSRDDVVRLELLDLNGTVVTPILRQVPLKAGVSRIEFSTSDLESGAYFCRLVTAGREVYVQKLMVSH